MTTIIKLSTREARKKLKRPADPKSRIEPYFVQHSHGVSIGYRPSSEPGAAGQRILREFKPGKPRAGT